MNHYPSPSYLTPNNVFVFPLIKYKVPGHRFRSQKEAVGSYKSHAYAIQIYECYICLKIVLFE